jgi:hypothetical protein
MNHFLVYWTAATADANLSRGGMLTHAASEQFSRVNPGDVVWIVTCRRRHLYLLVRIMVGEVTDQRGAEAALKSRELWKASFHVLAAAGTELPMMDLNISHLAAALRFDSPMRSDRLNVHDGEVNAQQLQTMRRLTADTAELLEGVLRTPSTGAARRPKPGEDRPSNPKPKPSSKAGSSKAEGLPEYRVALRRLHEAGRRSDDLLKPQYRGLDRRKIPLNGLCYVLSECMFHLFPGAFQPYRINWGEGDTHWFLRMSDGTIFETTAAEGEECYRPTEYAEARRASFFTKQPSKRARALLERAGFASA